MFTCGFDPIPTARQVFTFHRPETLARWHEDHVNTGYGPLRAGIQLLPELGPEGAVASAADGDQEPGAVASGTTIPGR